MSSSTAADALSTFKPPIKLVWRLGWLIVAIPMFGLYRILVRGREHVPASGPYLIIANHQSHWDPPIVGMLSFRRCYISIGRIGLFGFKPFGWLLRQIGCVALNPKSGGAAAMRAALEALEAGWPVLMFPEGSRTETGATDEFLPGMLVLVKRSGAPVLPVALDGAHDAWPRGQTWPNLRGRVAVKAGPVIPASELLALPPKEAMELLRRRVETMRMELRRELRERTRGRRPAPDAGDVAYWEQPASG